MNRRLYFDQLEDRQMLSAIANFTVLSSAIAQLSGPSQLGTKAIEVQELSQLFRLHGGGGEVASVTSTMVRQGDVNKDGSVDLLDFQIIRRNLGHPGGWQDGDINGDYRVDLADFALAKSNFGKTSASAAEPLQCGAHDPHGCFANLPQSAVIPPFVDPYEGNSFATTEHPSQPPVEWIKEFYPSGEERSFFSHKTGDDTTRYPSGNFMRISYSDLGKTAYLLDEDFNPDDPFPIGRVSHEIYTDGRENRYQYWGDSSQHQAIERYVDGSRISLEIFYSNGQTALRILTDANDGTSKADAFYPSGNVKFVYSEATGKFTTFLDEAFHVDSAETNFGRTVAQGTLEEWRLFRYWGQTDSIKQIVYWEGDLPRLTENRAADGSLQYFEIPPRLRPQEQTVRDENGMVIRRPSDSLLNFAYGPGEAQLRSSQVVDSLWMTAIRVDLRDDPASSNGYASSRPVFEDLTRNFNLNNPQIDLGSYFNFVFAGSRNELLEANQYPRGTYDLSHIPAEFAVLPTANSSYSAPYVNLTIPEAREWVLNEITATALGERDRPKLDSLYLDSVGLGSNFNGTWAQKKSILVELKQRLNEAGVFLEANIGNYGFYDLTYTSVADPEADLMAIANGITIESPWRINDRTYQKTQQIVRNMRELLDNGMSIGILAAHFGEAKSGAARNLTSHPYQVLSIQEATQESETGTRRALLVTLDRPHSIFPTSGSENDSIRIENLTGVHEIWNGSYRPAPTDRPDQIILYHSWNDIPSAPAAYNAGGGANVLLYDIGGLRRLFAGLAMMIRNEGHSIAVNFAVTSDLPGNGEPNHPDNWLTWPEQFGRPLGDFVIDETSPGSNPNDPQVVRMHRDFENGTITIFPQEDRVETLFH